MHRWGPDRAPASANTGGKEPFLRTTYWDRRLEPPNRPVAGDGCGGRLVVVVTRDTVLVVVAEGRNEGAETDTWGRRAERPCSVRRAN